MRSSLAISRRINAKHVAITDESSAETIGVMRKDGSFGYVKWLGFIDTFEAKNLLGARAVKLEVARIGVRKGLGNQWKDLSEGEYVMGCLISEGAYAVADVNLRTIKAEPKKN